MLSQVMGSSPDSLATVTADRLVKEKWLDSGDTQLYCFAYDYDAAGNRTQEDKDGTSVYYHYDAANQLMKKETVGTGWTYYDYDLNGSLIREHDQAAAQTTYYEYADNGLTRKIIPPTGSPTEFHYDARLQRYAIDWAGTQAYYQWDGLNQLVEKDASLSTVAAHTHGHTPIEGIGSVIVGKRGADYQYPHYDHRGSLFEIEKDAVTDLEADYNAFGEELQRTGAAVTRFGYQGTAWMRLNGGLYGSPTRVYRPDGGRYHQRDLAPRLQTRVLSVRNPEQKVRYYCGSMPAFKRYKRAMRRVGMRILRASRLRAASVHSLGAWGQSIFRSAILGGMHVRKRIMELQHPYGGPSRPSASDPSGLQDSCAECAYYVAQLGLEGGLAVLEAVMAGMPPETLPANPETWACAAESCAECYQAVPGFVEEQYEDYLDWAEEMGEKYEEAARAVAEAAEETAESFAWSILLPIVQAPQRLVEWAINEVTWGGYFLFP